MKAVTMVDIIPMANPEYMKAIGMARIPVPREAFSRCVRVSIFLLGRKLKVLIN